MRRAWFARATAVINFPRSISLGLSLSLPVSVGVCLASVLLLPSPAQWFFLPRWPPVINRDVSMNLWISFNISMHGRRGPAAR